MTASDQPPVKTENFDVLSAVLWHVGTGRTMSARGPNAGRQLGELILRALRRRSDQLFESMVAIATGPIAAELGDLDPRREGELAILRRLSDYLGVAVAASSLPSDTAFAVHAAAECVARAAVLELLRGLHEKLEEGFYKARATKWAAETWQSAAMDTERFKAVAGVDYDGGYRLLGCVADAISKDYLLDQPIACRFWGTNVQMETSTEWLTAGRLQPIVIFASEHDVQTWGPAPAFEEVDVDDGLVLSLSLQTTGQVRLDSRKAGPIKPHWLQPPQFFSERSELNLVISTPDLPLAW